MVVLHFDRQIPTTSTSWPFFSFLFLLFFLSIISGIFISMATASETVLRTFADTSNEHRPLEMLPGHHQRPDAVPSE